jgi:hypothetical protein
MTTQANAPTPEEVQAERLKELRKREAARQEVAQAEDDARELQELELVERLEADGLGVRGKGFEVVNTPFGVFGIKKPDARGMAAWDKASGSGANSDRLTGILRNYIVPESDAMRFHAVCSDTPGVTQVVAAAFLFLSGNVRFEQKKR